MATSLVQVIQTDEGRRGLGTTNSPIRRITRYFTPDGLLLAEVDDWLISRVMQLRDQAIVAKRENDVTTLAAVAMSLAGLDALPGDTGHAS